MLWTMNRLSALHPELSRRAFVFAAACGAAAAQTAKRIPIGLQQTAVGRNIQQDLNGTLRAVAGMGYDLIEFSAGTFMKWSPAEAKQVRTLLDEVKLKCRSTHNEIVSFTGDGLTRAIELNHIIGSDTLVSVRGPGTAAAPGTADQWKRFNEQLSQAAGSIRAAKMTLGFHNHEIEFRQVEGIRPMDILAANKDITSFHLNIGLCLKGGGDPVAFIRQVPGRIQSVLCQDYEGKARWKEIFAAAEGAGGLQFYLLQRTDGLYLVPREGEDLLDFAHKDLDYFRKLRS
ncbi:MAG: Xylose isomerase domain protein barrel [Bryobacterales bacterium]|nr:Xylose isomerase domain protein barrel [Bryobacterales bacterium]